MHEGTSLYSHLCSNSMQPESKDLNMLCALHGTISSPGVLLSIKPESMMCVIASID